MTGTGIGTGIGTFRTPDRFPSGSSLTVRSNAPIYPALDSSRDRWVLSHRPPRTPLDPWRPYHFVVEPEVGPDGSVVEVVTVFLTNRECPFRCVMCDLWRNTLVETVPEGAIAAQVRYA